ncbi:MAG: GNAT family N-acetyltransferase [Pseudomonadales bacterium]|nr:GNAT family N-acetyltransferase [Pseudomonadales bacterium]
MKIRDQLPGDLGWIISVHGEVYTREFGFDASFETNIADKIVKYFSGTDDFNKVWIADVEGNRAGSVAVRALPENVGFVNFVVVLDAYRGKGIANSLMDKVIEHGKAYGKEKLRLETFSCLVSAREMYKKLGFEIVEANELDLFSRTMVQEFWELPL